MPVDMDIDRIDEAPVGGLVGAHPLAIGREKMVERVDPGSIGANRLRVNLQYSVKVAKSPQPVSCFGLQCIKMGR